MGWVMWLGYVVLLYSAFYKFSLACILQIRYNFELQIHGCSLTGCIEISGLDQLLNDKRDWIGGIDRAAIADVLLCQ